jgi:hypothetical protein
MAIPVTVTLEQKPDGGYKFQYSSPDPGVVTYPDGPDGLARIHVPHSRVVGLVQDVTLTLERGPSVGSATFIQDPVVWANESGLEGTPSAMTVDRESETEVVLRVINENSTSEPIPHAFFLVVLMRGSSEVLSIFGSDPILIEEPGG